MHIQCGNNCNFLVGTAAKWYDLGMKDKFWAKRKHTKKTGCRECAKLSATGRPGICCFVRP
jgi:hypothetical protein